MEGKDFLWMIFGIIITSILTLDLFVLHRKPHEIKLKESIVWSIIWIACALLFQLLISIFIDSQTGITFLTGYVIELSLSIDNLFVFLLIFSYFAVPTQYQHRVLFWGILGAITMRAIIIFAGVSLVNRFHWIMYLFGAFLIFSGIKMSFGSKQQIKMENSRILRILKQIVPLTDRYENGHFLSKINGHYVATLLFIVLIMIEFADLVFATDSLPAIFGISRDPFIVFTSNIFAISGLRTFYFALATFMKLFQYLNYGLSVVLIFIGIKILLVDLYKIPINISLLVVSGVLLISIIASILQNRKNNKNVC
jgi:tellurite resistance protein TerC